MNNTTLILGGLLLGSFFLFNNKSNNTVTTGTNPNPYNGSGGGVTINGTFIPFAFLQDQGYQFIDGNWLSPAAIELYIANNGPGPHWTTVVTNGLNTALDFWNQFNNGGNFAPLTATNSTGTFGGSFSPII